MEGRGGINAFLEYCSILKNRNQQSVQQGNITRPELLKYLCSMKRLQNSDKIHLMGQDHFNT